VPLRKKASRAEGSLTKERPLSPFAGPFLRLRVATALCLRHAQPKAARAAHTRVSRDMRAQLHEH